MNMMAVQMGAKSGDDEDAKSDAGARMGANAKNPMLTKNPKKEKE